MPDRQELATRALKELRLIGEGQSASAGENADALAAIEPLLERLRFDRTYAQQNTYSFANNVFYPLAVLLAEDLAVSLAGRPRDELVATRAENQLMRIQKQPLVRNELQFDRALTRPNREGFNA